MRGRRGSRRRSSGGEISPRKSDPIPSWTPALRERSACVAEAREAADARAPPGRRTRAREHQNLRGDRGGGSRAVAPTGMREKEVVDQERGIAASVGMTGARVEVEMYLATVQASAAENLRKSVQRAGYRVADLVLEPLAASYAILTDDEKELGVALVEVGGSSTGVAIFHEGKIRHLASLKYAGSHVTSDLVQGLGVTQSDAERLKERHGAAYSPLVSADEVVSLPSTAGQGARTAPRELVAHIIHQRVDQDLPLVGPRIHAGGFA